MMYHMVRTTEERFWAKVQRGSGCWEWTAFRSPAGYGRFMGEQRTVWQAHRFAWTLAHGDIAPGLVVCHSCDNPPCVRPSHLFLGTHQDNVTDCELKGRRAPMPSCPPRSQKRGEQLPASRLTENSVREIRRLYAAGNTTHRQLALQFGVCEATVQHMLTGKTWRHVM